MCMPITGMAMTCKITEYSWESGNITASGESVHIGGCACDFLPLGTIIYVNGIPYTVNDRIGEGKNSRHVDIWVDSTDEANQWGVQYLDVEW